MLWLLSLPLRWTIIFSYFVKEYVFFILWEFPTQGEVKEPGREKIKKKIFYIPFSWFILISGICLVLACRSDSDSYYGFGSWHWILNGISLWLNPSLLTMSSTHRLSHLRVMMSKSFDIPRSDPMARFDIGSCSITTGFY